MPLRPEPADPATAQVASAPSAGVLPGIPEALDAVTAGANDAVPAYRELLSAGDIGRIVDRIAHQILERCDSAEKAGDVVLLGIPTRGVALAHRLGERLEAFAGRPFPVGSLDITLYRDDLRRRGPRALARTDLPDGGIDDRIVILVDDVLFSGRSIRAALDALRDHGRPASVQLAVVVDRGHRELPIRADYVGKNVPTAAADAVAVRLAEVDGYDSVELRRAP